MNLFPQNRYVTKKITTIFLILVLLITVSKSTASTEIKHKAASNLSVINYARGLLLTIVDDSFRGSWVVDAENQGTIQKKSQKIFESLAKVKIGSNVLDVRKILSSPQEIKNNSRTWIYGLKQEDGTYKDLVEVFFDEKGEQVIGVLSFNPQSIVEKVGVTIGDTIDKMITVYGEPVDEKDFIEDPDNKDYLGLYYLYPRSGIGFLLGQDKSKKDLLVQGVLVFGKP